MKVLIACEESQEVCKAFRARGHEAYSADIQEPSGGHPEWHILGDVLPIINGDCDFTAMDGKQHRIVGEWDLLIAHPPCTYLTNAGARWLWAGRKLNEDRYQKGLDGKAFFMAFLNADCPRIAVENPVPSAAFEMPPCSQVVQPFEYGHPYSKKNLSLAERFAAAETDEHCNIVENHAPFVSSGSYSKTHDPKYKGASRKGGAAKSRSKTFSGIAAAMAEQWGGSEQ